MVVQLERKEMAAVAKGYNMGGVIATLAGVVTVPPAWIDWAPSLHSLYWLRSVPAAIATIAASYLGSFNYREDAVRHEITGNALWNEMARFQSCAAPYNNKTEEEDTSRFTIISVE
jgi:hypothetical protein